MIQIPNVAAIYTLERLWSVIDPWIHLYRTDTPLSYDTVLADFVEVSIDSYAPVRLQTWTDPEIESRRAVTTRDPVEWVWSSGDAQQEVWGYYVTDGRDGPLLWCGRGEAPPYLVGADRQPVRIVPRYSYAGEQRFLATGL